MKLGADAVVMSVHKTLPAFTQNALLHLNGDRISEEKVARYLGIFETSSPSYVLMAGIDESLRMVKEQGKELFTAYRKNLERFYQKVEPLQALHVMNRKDLTGQDAFGWDDAKLVIFTGETGLTGEQLHRILLEHYHLEMEMVSGDYVLGMTSFLDTGEGFDRLAEALLEIDRCAWGTGMNRGRALHEVQEAFIEKIYQKNPRIMQIYEAEDRESQLTPLQEAAGKVAAGTVFLYPPGIPMIVPGEVITESLIQNITKCKEIGLLVEGDMLVEKNKDCIFLKTILY